METRKIWANLGVDDLERTTQFYTKLGFRSNGASKELTSFFVGEDNFVIHFFLKQPLRSSIKGDIADLNLGNEILFTLSADSEEEVRAWENEVKNAGGTIVSSSERFGKGYFGFVFADPDGHRFNVFHM